MIFYCSFNLRNSLTLHLMYLFKCMWPALSLNSLYLTEHSVDYLSLQHWFFTICMLFATFSRLISNKYISILHNWLWQDTILVLHVCVNKVHPSAPLQREYPIQVTCGVEPLTPDHMTRQWLHHGSMPGPIDLHPQWTSPVYLLPYLPNYTALSINTQQAYNNILLRTLFSSLFFFWVCQIVWMKQMNIPEYSSLSRRGKYSNTRVKVCWQPCDTFLKWWPWTNRKQKYQMSKTIYLAMESRSW